MAALRWWLWWCVAAAPRFEAEVADAVADAAPVFAVPPSLVMAVVEVESAFEPSAVSSAGARGLMQVMPFHATRLGLRSEAELFVPRLNVLAGVRLLAALLRHFRGDVIDALVGYHSGAKPHGVVPNNGQTPAYVVRVLRAWRRWGAR